MKALISSLIGIGLLVPTSVTAQQINNFPVCTNYQENYLPGTYDYNGNYVPGNVAINQYNYNCNRNQYSYNNQYRYRYQNNGYYNNGYYNNQNYGYNNLNRNCNPTRTLLGATLGGAIGRAAASNYPRNYGWATVLGASIGGLAYSC